MNVYIVIAIITGYFLLLMIIANFTSGKAENKTFFLNNRQSKWYIVAFGMIGTTLSGVTFISVPGWVLNTNFSYFQIIIGYIAGYTTIALVLLPLYYRLNLTTIYGYLEQRFGKITYKTGAFYFLLSRTIGSAFRLFIVANVFQIFIFNHWNFPFWVSVAASLLLILVYTYRGGISTIVWTDTLQTFFLLTAMGTTIVYVYYQLNVDTGIIATVANSGYAQIFHWDWKSPDNFFKQFLSGAFIAIVMTGLDQDMMQKNLSCRNIKEAQKNMYVFTSLQVVVNLLFLSLGALLYLYASHNLIALPERTDDLYPMLAFEYFPAIISILFLLGLTAAAYSSADSALAALTTSFCVDFLNFEKKNIQSGESKKTRYMVHGGFTLVIFIVIMLFHIIADQSVISMIFTAAIYTYGPLLGLFAYGLFTKFKTYDRWVPVVCVIAPILTYILNINSEVWFNGYKFGFELLPVNGLITCIGLYLIGRRGKF